METLDIYVGDGGQVQAVYDDRLAVMLVGLPVRRASHVEPAAGGGWEADMAPVGGPVLRQADGRAFTTRAAALVAERDWLDARLRAGRL